VCMRACVCADTVEPVFNQTVLMFLRLTFYLSWSLTVIVYKWHHYPGAHFGFNVRQFLFVSHKAQVKQPV